MNYEKIQHYTQAPYLSSQHDRQIQIMIRTGKEVEQVNLIYGDPHHFENKNNEWLWKYEQTQMFLTGETSQFKYFRITVSAPNHRLKYLFELKNETTQYYGDNKLFKNLNVRDIWNFYYYPYVHESELFSAPKWAENIIWYEIFPDRFNNESNSIPPLTKVDNHTHLGGNLKGIINKLDYLENLGVTGLYLTPIFTSDTVHKYDTIDYYNIDPHFGTKDDFRKFVEEAHKHNIKVLLDGVFNHTGTKFFAWEEAQKGNKQYIDWYHIDGKHYETFSFAKNMPKLNTENPEVVDYFCNLGQYWIKEFGIDGWRLDVSNELSFNFLRRFYSAVKSVNKGAYVIGEIWHDANPWLKGDIFDGVMNYPLTRSILNNYVLSDFNPHKFIDEFVSELHRYPFEQSKVMFNLFDSHDTKRLFTLANEDINKTKFALALLMFSPGSPCIYYGTEVPMSGSDDPDNRRPMIFDHNETSDMFVYLKKLIKLRSQLAPLKHVNDYIIEIVNEEISIKWANTHISLNPQTNVIKFNQEII